MVSAFDGLSGFLAGLATSFVLIFSPATGATGASAIFDSFASAGFDGSATDETATGSAGTFTGVAEGGGNGGWPSLAGTSTEMSWVFIGWPERLGWLSKIIGRKTIASKPIVIAPISRRLPRRFISISAADISLFWEAAMSGIQDQVDADSCRTSATVWNEPNTRILSFSPAFSRAAAYALAIQECRE